MHSEVREFASLFQLPPAMLPYVDSLVSEQEMALVLGLGRESMTVTEVARMMDLPRKEADQLLHRAFCREVVTKRTEEGVDLYAAGTFYARMDVLAMFESKVWSEIPAEARRELEEWQLQEYIDLWMPMLEQIQQDPDVFTGIKNRDILLLDEALELVEAATDHVITRCDCRAIINVDDDPISEVCVRLNDGARMTVERGQGRRISKEEMKALVIETDRSGLIHAGLRDYRGHEDQLFGFCNCNADYCYPVRAGKKLGMPKAYPRSHHVAEYDEELCIQCRICTERCQFGAIYSNNDAVVGSQASGSDRIHFDPENCWGCGLCATACPQGAIVMRPLVSSEGDR